MEPEPSLEQPLSYAGFMIRAAARIIDLFIIFAALNLIYVFDLFGSEHGWWHPFAIKDAGNGAVPASTLLRLAFYSAIPAFYFIYLHGNGGQTVGKMVLRIKVINEDRTALGMRKAFFRWLVEFLFNTVLGVLLVIIVLLLAIVVEYVISNISSVFPPAEYLMSAFTWVMGLVIFFLMSVPSAIMFLWAAFDGRKQGLHDKVCRTLVVRTAAASPEGNAVMERLPPEPAAPPPDPLDTRENPPI